ncbi:hypothetical protein K461DRAFT_276586 [Myriangium duriaei CBS 260.36]|uniref:Uncharacterized protein n=1 Tax=Myriangium duriaei CBS 260.36 TaxID=1168546 RepID=A0A9P4JAD2_9PEZI|nr:hypothetical protein K461DRAFT_276586 [Myriangium duriaei CBS 260.36]
MALLVARVLVVSSHASQRCREDIFYYVRTRSEEGPQGKIDRIPNMTARLLQLYLLCAMLYCCSWSVDGPIGRGRQGPCITARKSV